MKEIEAMEEKRKKILKMILAELFPHGKIMGTFEKVGHILSKMLGVCFSQRILLHVCNSSKREAKGNRRDMLQAMGPGVHCLS